MTTGDANSSHAPHGSSDYVRQQRRGMEDEFDVDDSGGIKDLRDAAERGRKATQELDNMKREMAFLKAGVDTESKAGQLLYKAYDGELETELIQAEASELGILKGNAPASQQESTTRDVAGVQEREALAGDSISPEVSTQNPYDQGFQEFKTAYDSGKPKDESAARFVHTVLEAAGRGDERVIDRR